MDFLMQHSWVIILILLAVVTYIVRLKMVGEKQVITELRGIAYGLMLIAEKRFSDDNGKLKMRFVIDKFYPVLPKIMKFLVRKQDLEIMLQSFYDDLKDHIGHGDA